MKNLIKRILKEEIDDDISWADDLEPFSFDKEMLIEFRNLLKSLKYDLSDSGGLGLDKIIRKMLEPYITEVPKDKLEEFTEGLRILYRTKKYSRNEIIAAKQELDNLRMIYDDGKWNQVNKLNTNYSDLSEMVTKYLVNEYPEHIFKIFELLKTNKYQAIRFIKPLLKDLPNKYSLDDLKTFTRNSFKNSEVGEKSEDMVEEFLKTKGFNIDYRGGNGDFVDMKFGVDIIADMKLIQVKASLKSVSRIRPQIDFIGVANEYQGVGIYDRNGRIVEHNGEKLCYGRLCNLTF